MRSNFVHDITFLNYLKKNHFKFYPVSFSPVRPVAYSPHRLN